jgi:hypothetical protein
MLYIKGSNHYCIQNIDMDNKQLVRGLCDFYYTINTINQTSYHILTYVILVTIFQTY